jgi:hypothetical protein
MRLQFLQRIGKPPQRPMGLAVCLAVLVGLHAGTKQLVIAAGRVRILGSGDVAPGVTERFPLCG